jgi:glucokinase
MLLAADVGGTKILMGLFERGVRRPRAVVTETYATAVFTRFRDVVEAFRGRVGVAGPVLGRRATLTNRPLVVSADDTAAFGVDATLLNDLEALAHSVEVLETNDLTVLQAGAPQPHGHAALIAAGTGLGQAYLHRVDGRLTPSPSEGGHADFAARSDREFALVQQLRATYGRAEVEHVVSGPGLVHLHRFTHGGQDCPATAGVRPEGLAAGISASGLARTCPPCAEALDLFVSAYGAEAGNLALRGLATAGLFVGGGIAPRILPALEGGEFMEAFCDKAPMRALLTQVPVYVIRTPDAGLLGAATHAQRFTVGGV